MLVDFFHMLVHSAVTSVTDPSPPSQPLDNRRPPSFLPDPIKSIQNAAFCQLNGIQAEKNQQNFSVPLP